VGAVSAPAAAQLDYAPTPRFAAARRWARRLAPLLVLAFLLPGVYYRRPIADRARLLQAQRRAAAHALPPDAVVLVNDPAVAARLVADRPDRYGYVWPNQPPAARSEPVWAELRALLPAPAAALPLVKRVTNAPATAFVGELRSPSGNRRLVALDLYYAGPWSSVSIDFRATVVTPASLFAPAVVRATRCEPITTTTGTFAFAVRRSTILAGRPNPADPTHVTIPYHLDGATGLIDAHLEDDDTLTVRVRSGPATRWLGEHQIPDSR
jgi:hypothetical protein